ncbi:MAG TPA: aminotransferase class V-fold PLP-dependent enzyme [Casimicrobiaceae bacterium]|jgi:kynureninase
MSSQATSIERIESAIAALGAGPLTESALERHVAPLFSRHKLLYGDRIYLANHSLGRPLNATEDDVREGLSHWYAELGGAWDPWGVEIDAYRARLASLLGAQRADSIVPKTSAGQGLRAVLNTYERVPRVIATRGEFDSLDVILREYAHRGRIVLNLVEARDDGNFDSDDIVVAIGAGTDLVVVSEVIFNTGQRLRDLAKVVAATHAGGGKLMLDVYHSLGVFPVDISSIDADFAVGGSYKYLRGGPGACFLYVHPRHLDANLRTLDTGWFAKEAPFAYARPDPPRFASGGDGWFESTPPVLPFYQARAGQVFTKAIGIARLREYSLALQRRLIELLGANDVHANGGRDDRGAFVVVEHPRAVEVADGLRQLGIVVDARGRYLRWCPDCLTTDDELVRSTDAAAPLLH